MKITKEQIIKSGRLSPGLIGGEIVYFLLASKNLYFINHSEDGPYSKDNKGKYIKMPLEEVVEARELYLTSFWEKEKSEAIQEELKIIKKALKEEAEALIKTIEKYDRWRLYKYDGFTELLSTAFTGSNYDLKKENKKKADKFFEGDNEKNYLEIKDKLKDYLLYKDYEQIYFLFNSGKPIGTFSTKGDLTALINVFGADNINKSIDTLKESPLLLLAEINVNKKYFPQ